MYDWKSYRVISLPHTRHPTPMEIFTNDMKMKNLTNMIKGVLCNTHCHTKYIRTKQMRLAVKSFRLHCNFWWFCCNKSGKRYFYQGLKNQWSKKSLKLGGDTHHLILQGEVLFISLKIFWSDCRLTDCKFLGFLCFHFLEFHLLCTLTCTNTPTFKTHIPTPGTFCSFIRLFSIKIIL